MPNTNVVKFYNKTSFLTSTQFDDGDEYFFIETPSLVNCEPKLRSDSPNRQIESIPWQASTGISQLRGMEKALSYVRKNIRQILK